MSNKVDCIKNNSIQKYMKELNPSDCKNHGRRDQSPQPNYPNFESVKLGHSKYGDVGWGLNKPSLKYQ